MYKYILMALLISILSINVSHTLSASNPYDQTNMMNGDNGEGNSDETEDGSDQDQSAEEGTY